MFDNLFNNLGIAVNTTQQFIKAQVSILNTQGLY